jgi:hypothetical protein
MEDGRQTLRFGQDQEPQFDEVWALLTAAM